MRFVIETDTLRAEGRRTWPNENWSWEVTRAGIRDDENVRLLLASGNSGETLLVTITLVLGELASVARQQAELLEHETAVEEDDREVFDENGASLGRHTLGCKFPEGVCTCGEVAP